MAYQVSLGTNLIQKRNSRELSGLFHSLETKLILGAKFMTYIAISPFFIESVYSYFALFYRVGLVCNLHISKFIELLYYLVSLFI
jgi:hypothetical protein